MLKSTAIGRLTGDPVMKELQLGADKVTVCEFSIAVNYGYKGNEKTEYIDCVAWRKLGEIIGQYAGKGRRVYVAGKQATRKFPIQKDGVEFMDRRVEWTLDEFEFCDDNPANKGEGSAPASNQYQAPTPPAEKAPYMNTNNAEVDQYVPF